MREDGSLASRRTWRGPSWAAFTAALAAAAIACARPPVERPTTPGGRAVRLLTYNVNFGIPGDRETVAAIRDATADVMLLQETNAAWERALRAAFSADYPFLMFENRGGAGGMAILSRFPLSQAERLPPAGDGWFPAARVVIDGPFGPFQALSVHLRPPVSDGGSYVIGHFTTPAVRVREITAFFAALAPGYPTLVAGDFNEEEDGDAVKVLLTHGMASALRRYAPDQPTWSWPSPVGTLHRQLDHVFYDPRLDVVSAEIRKTGRSDHYPVIAVVVARPPAAAVH